MNDPVRLNIMKQMLNESIQHVSRAISSRTTIPILSGIKIDANSDGLILTSTDTDISIQSFIPIEQDGVQIISMEQAGSIVLPAKFFVEIIRKLPGEWVEIDVNENLITKIRSGATEIDIIGMEPEEFPILPKLDESRMFSIESDILSEMIQQTVFAASTNESTPILTGVLWQWKEGQFKFVATDRHRLATRYVDLQINTDEQFDNIVISGKTLNELNRLLPDQSTLIDIVVADNQVLFKIDRILFYTRILDGVYPDTSKIIPQQYKTEIKVNTKMLLDAIDRAYLLSREERTNIVHLEINNTSYIEISSSLSELGKIREQCEVDFFAGELLKIAFNAKYMLDALKVIDSETVQIGFTGTMSPIIVKPEDHDFALHLVLPYRTS